MIISVISLVTLRKENYLKSRKIQEAIVIKKRESPSDGEAFVTIPALAAIFRESWIVDSGAISQMCNNKSMFIDLRHLNIPQEVTLDDEISFEGLAESSKT